MSFRIGNYTASLQNLENALHIAHQINDKRKAAETHLNLSKNI
jgi:hypothetical protein